MARLFPCSAQCSIVLCNKSKRKPMTKRFSIALAAAVLGCSLGVTAASAEEPKPLGKGVASWYGPGFHGKKTAHGERFNTHEAVQHIRSDRRAQDPALWYPGPGHERADGQV